MPAAVLAIVGLGLVGCGNGVVGAAEPGSGVQFLLTFGYLPLAVGLGEPVERTRRVALLLAVALAS
ncbi:MAG: hypothetical protein ACRD0K_18870 [Egibacteraceae bacterium]